LYKKKRLNNEEKNLSELTKFVLNSYRNLCQTQEKLQTIKTENRMKYSLIIIMICLIFAYIGIKINGFYVSYLVMLILFTLPAIVYHKLIQKLLKRLAPILEQLDESMEYKRRTLIDRKDLLVKIKTPGLNEFDDDDEDIEKIQMKDHSFIINDDDEQKRILKNTEKQPNLSDSSFDMLSDSSSSTADDEIARLNELYASVGDKIDGKHRIKIKGDEIKIKGRSKIVNKNFFQTNNSGGEPDLTSFDFLNEYHE